MLTDRQIKSLKTDRPQMDVFDGDISGFGVRVTNKARKSFFLFYRSRRIAVPHRRLHRKALMLWADAVTALTVTAKPVADIDPK